MSPLTKEENQMSINIYIQELKSMGYSPAQICSILDWNHEGFNWCTAPWEVDYVLKLTQEEHDIMIKEYNAVEGEWDQRFR